MYLYTYPFLNKAIEQINPVKVYTNFKNDRILLIKDNNKKPGIYCLVNLINGHSYVGSSISLGTRMRNYLNNSFLKNIKNANMPITKALLKYKHDNFAVLIIEYADENISQINVRETYWITKLLPYYNVLKQGYSSVGYKHTEVTKELLSDLAKNRIHSDKTKSLISKALIGDNNPFYGRSHTEKSKLKMITANSAYPVYIYNCLKKLLVTILIYNYVSEGILNFDFYCSSFIYLTIPGLHHISDNKLLNPQYVTGFSDAESSFIIGINSNKELKLG